MVTQKEGNDMVSGCFEWECMPQVGGHFGTDQAV